MSSIVPPPLYDMDFNSKSWKNWFSRLAGYLASFVTIDGTKDIVMGVGESWKVGDVASNSEFEQDGTLKFNGDATVWDDLRIVPGSFDRPGTSDPTMVVYSPGGGATNTYLWEFKKNDIASFTCQMPHGWKVGSDIHVHIHWTPGTRGAAENGHTVGWKIEYSWASIDGVFVAMATVDLSDACDGTDHKHQMTTDVTISGLNHSLSSMLLCNVRRTDTGADDTWASAASGQLPFLLEIDFHFEMDTVGSRSRLSK